MMISMQTPGIWKQRFARSVMAPVNPWVDARDAVAVDGYDGHIYSFIKQLHIKLGFHE
jgi:hypothetical protein